MGFHVGTLPARPATHRLLSALKGKGVAVLWHPEWRWDLFPTHARFCKPAHKPRPVVHFDSRFFGECFQTPISGEQGPAVSYGEDESKTVVDRELWPCRLVDQALRERLGIQRFNPKASALERVAINLPETNKLVLPQGIRYGELERKPEDVFQLRPFLQLDQDRGITDEDWHARSACGS